MNPTSARWVYLVGLFLPLISGLEECREDVDCLTQGTYCLQGFCDGHCIPCQQFLRNPPYSGDCAKREEDCGSCLPNTVAEELVGMRHAFQCKKVDEVSTQSFTIFGWPVWTLGVGTTLAFTVCCIIYKKRKQISGLLVICHRKLFGKSPSPSGNVNGVAENEHPINLDGQNEDETTQPLTSNVRPNEERSEDPPEASTTLPTSNSVAYSIEEESGGSENGSEEHNEESCEEQSSFAILIKAK